MKGVLSLNQAAKFRRRTMTQEPAIGLLTAEAKRRSPALSRGEEHLVVPV